MGDRAEQMLRQWGVPPNYVGYAYLLDAADLFRQGGGTLPQLFETIAQRHGKRGVPGPQGDGQRGQVPAHHRHGARPGGGSRAGSCPTGT